MQELSRSEYAVVTREVGFVRVRRTAKPMPIQANRATDDLIDAFRMAVPLRERKNLGLLLDSRDAPMLSDDDTATAMKPVMAEMLLGFARVAILVGSALGKLQATRRSREQAADDDRRPVSVFSDEASAIAYVLGQSSSTGPISTNGARR